MAQPDGIAEQIRRDFAAGWGLIGAAWGVAPSTASVQGYLLAHGGPLTEADVRRALGLSHRAALLALAECESWGLIEQTHPRRSGQRGPAARAWIPRGDHWEWFRRVAAVRKEREMDPVLPLLEECRTRASAAGATQLERRLDELVGFVRLFDRGMGAIVATEAATLARLFGVLGRLDERTVERLIAGLASVPEEDLVRAAESVAGMPPSNLRRLIRLAGHSAVTRLLGREGGHR